MQVVIFAQKPNMSRSRLSHINILKQAGQFTQQKKAASSWRDSTQASGLEIDDDCFVIRVCTKSDLYLV